MSSITTHNCSCSCEKPDNSIIYSSKKVKFVLFCPKSSGDRMREIIAEHCGGKIGNYSHCSVTTSVTARFKEMRNGKISDYLISTAEEEKIETVIRVEHLAKLITSLKDAHPYKKMGYDIIPLLKARL